MHSEKEGGWSENKSRVKAENEKMNEIVYGFKFSAITDEECPKRVNYPPPKKRQKQFSKTKETTTQQSQPKTCTTEK